MGKRPSWVRLAGCRTGLGIDVGWCLPETTMPGIWLIRAPSNLGLQPPALGRQPGTWRAPQALTEVGLVEAVRSATVFDLGRPTYDPAPGTGTRLLNGHAMRAFNLAGPHRRDAVTLTAFQAWPVNRYAECANHAHGRGAFLAGSRSSLGRGSI